MKRYTLVIFIFLYSVLYTEAHVELTYPSGGESFSSGELITIQWHELVSHNTLNWDLYYSTDGGASWQVIKEDISVSVMSYQWNLPTVQTNTAKIKIIQDNEVEDYEGVSGEFSIGTTTSLDNGAASFNAVVYPNPVTSYFTVEFENTQNDRFSFVLYNENGSQVRSIQNETSTKLVCKREDLPPGLYIYQLVKESKIQSSGKIIFK